LLVEDNLGLAVLVWVGYLVTVLGIGAGIALFDDVDGSIWEEASGLVSWYVAFFGGYVLYSALPLYVAHGRTRRDTAIEVLIFGVVFAAGIALLTTARYVIEYVIFGLLDWNRDLSGDNLFDSHGEIHIMLAEYWFTYMVWAAAGGLIGAAIYRYPEAGWISVVPAIVLVSFPGLGGGPTLMGFVTRALPSFETSSVAAFAALSIVSCAVAVYSTWYFVRDVPIRKR
jgi:hypothetical protein